MVGIGLVALDHGFDPLLFVLKAGWTARFTPLSTTVGNLVMEENVWEIYIVEWKITYFLGSAFFTVWVTDFGSK